MQNNFQNMGHLYPQLQGQQYGQQLPYQTGVPQQQQQFQQAAAGHRATGTTPSAGDMVGQQLRGMPQQHANQADEIDFDDIPSDEDDAGPAAPGSGPTSGAAAANLLQLQQAKQQQQQQQQLQQQLQQQQQQQQQQQYLMLMQQQRRQQQQQQQAAAAAAAQQKQQPSALQAVAQQLQHLQRPPAQQQARHMSTPTPTSHVGRAGLHPGAAQQPAPTSQQQALQQAIQQARQQQQQQRPPGAQGVVMAESGTKRARPADGPPPAPDDAVSLYEILMRAAKAGVLRQPSAAAGASAPAAAAAAAAAGVPAAAVLATEGPAQSVEDLLHRTQNRMPTDAAAAAAPAARGQDKLRDEDKVMPESGMKRLLELQSLNKAFKFGPGVVEQLQRLTQDFVSDTVSFGVELASHRRGATLRPTDLATYLERTHHLHVPGFTKEYHPYRRPAASELHRERSVAVRKAQLAPQQGGAGGGGDGAAGAAGGGGGRGGGGD